MAFSSTLTPTPVAGKAIPYTWFLALLDNDLDMNGRPWAAYITTWSNTGTANTLGNGTLAARWTKNGKTVSGTIALTWGSTTASGTGAWLFSLPSTAATLITNPQACGNGTANEVGVGVVGLTVALASTTLLAPYPTNGVSNGVSTTVPFTWGNTDAMSMFFSYEEA